MLLGLPWEDGWALPSHLTCPEVCKYSGMGPGGSSFNCLAFNLMFLFNWKLIEMKLIFQLKWNNDKQKKDKTTFLSVWLMSPKGDFFFKVWNFAFIFLLFIYLFIFLEANYNIVLVLPYIDMNPPSLYMCSPSWIPLPPPAPFHPSGSSQCTSPEHPVSCIKPGLAIHFIYNIHVSMPFSQTIPPSPSLMESKRLFYTSVSLLLSHI